MVGKHSYSHDFQWKGVSMTSQMPRSMSLFCQSLNFACLLYFYPSLNISKINKQGCGLARKGHGNAVKIGIVLYDNGVLSKCYF